MFGTKKTDKKDNAKKLIKMCNATDKKAQVFETIIKIKEYSTAIEHYDEAYNCESNIVKSTVDIAKSEAHFGLHLGILADTLNKESDLYLLTSSTSEALKRIAALRVMASDTIETSTVSKTKSLFEGIQTKVSFYFFNISKVQKRRKSFRRSFVSIGKKRLRIFELFKKPFKILHFLL
jgi:hypothetical protein